MFGDLPLLLLLHYLAFMNRAAEPSHKLGGCLGQQNLEEKSGRRNQVLWRQCH